MKLKDKQTGEIVELEIKRVNDKYLADQVIRTSYGEDLSLETLAKHYEDYEEPETFWYMTAWGDVKEYSQDQFAVKQKQAIGNYFGTKEEAEKAVEILKAIKRLKDHNFHFLDHIDRDCGEGIARYEWDGYINGEDLDLLFGGEE